jgi:branched-chain amino acid transport system ATP-binding protein
VFGIAGPNGAGKTTLFNMITGIPYGPDSGKILFNNIEINNMYPPKIYKLGISRTFQQEIAFDSLTVAESMVVSSRFCDSNVSTKMATKQINDVLKLMRLDGLDNKISRNLPFFEKKKLMLATAIVSNPKLLMLDEPAAGLSQEERSELLDLIAALKARGMSIIIIEHVLPILFGVSDRLMVMDAGSLLTIDTPSKIRKDDRVIAAYLGNRRVKAEK